MPMSLEYYVLDIDHLRETFIGDDMDYYIWLVWFLKEVWFLEIDPSLMTRIPVMHTSPLSNQSTTEHYETIRNFCIDNHCFTLRKIYPKFLVFST